MTVQELCIINKFLVMFSTLIILSYFILIRILHGKIHKIKKINVACFFTKRFLILTFIFNVKSLIQRALTHAELCTQITHVIHCIITVVLYINRTLYEWNNVYNVCYMYGILCARKSLKPRRWNIAECMTYYRY